MIITIVYGRMRLFASKRGPERISSFRIEPTDEQCRSAMLFCRREAMGKRTHLRSEVIESFMEVGLYARQVEWRISGHRKVGHVTNPERSPAGLQTDTAIPQ